MFGGGKMKLLTSIVVRTTSMAVTAGCLAASPRGVWLSWGVLHPDVEDVDHTESFDAIVVLSGEDRRIERGLELAEAGRVPVFVAMYGEIWSGIRDQCGTRTTFTTLCPIPPEDSTRGEARLIGQLAVEKNWRSIVVITGDYHVTRARLLIERCLDSSVSISFDAIEWPDLSLGVFRAEVLKTFRSQFPKTDC